MSEENLSQGAFVASLKRNNKQIKSDRAEAISEDAQMSYRRRLEDMEMKLKRMRRQQENMLDMSPDNTQSLMVAKDFDATGYVDQDTALALEIRNTEILFELAQKRYHYLFGAA